MKTKYIKSAVAAFASIIFAGCAHYDNELVPKVEVSDITITSLPVPIGEGEKIYAFARPDFVSLSSPVYVEQTGALTFAFDRWPDSCVPAYALYDYVNGAPYDGASINEKEITAALPTFQKDCPDILAGPVEPGIGNAWQVRLLPVCARLKMSFSNHDDIASFSVFSAQGKPLSGDISISLESLDVLKPEITVKNAVDSVARLSVSKAFARGEFTLAVLPSEEFTPVLWFTDTLGRRVTVKYEDTFTLSPGSVVEIPDCDKNITFGIDPSDVDFGNEGMTPGGEYDGEWKK